MFTAVSLVGVVFVNGAAASRAPAPPALAPSVSVPAAPSHVTATRAVKSASVRWAAPSSNGGSPITGYVITCDYHGRVVLLKTITSTALSAIVHGLPVGRTYTFRVAARNRFGIGPKSAPSNVATPTAKLGPNRPPRAGGYFRTLAPGAALPTGSSCAARVHYSPWEPRPDNHAANDRTPPWPVHERNHPDFNNTFNARFRPRINGDFTGTTNEIIQWAACKWGISDEIIRAEAVDETDWHMNEDSDFEPRSNGHCALGDRRDPCPTSFGILQIKWYYNPDANRANNSYPWSKNDTAFSLDYTLAWLRGCYEGWEYFGKKARGDLWGCLGGWYSGSWRDSGALDYINRVQHNYNTKQWRHW